MMYVYIHIYMYTYIHMSLSLASFGRGDDTVGNPHRGQTID